MHVLVVEPDNRIAEHINTLLGTAGHTMSRARSAQGAIQSVDVRRPDAIILEFHLQKHNGVEFLYELRSYEDCRNIPVIAYTFAHPNTFPSDEHILGQLGIIEYFYKPSTRLEQLLGAIKRVEEPLLT